MSPLYFRLRILNKVSPTQIYENLVLARFSVFLIGLAFLCALTHKNNRTTFISENATEP